MNRPIIHNQPAEQAFLGALLVKNAVHQRVVEFLKPDHFAVQAHEVIYRHCERLILAGRIADVITLRDAMEHSGELADAGGVEYLAQLVTAMVGIINAVEYAQVIVDAWRRRRLVEIAAEVTDRAYDTQGAPPDQIVADAVAEIEGAFRTDADRGVTMAGAATASAIAASDAAARGEGIVGLLTGFPAWDAMLGGLEDGQMHVLGGRPAMGKSALGWQIAVDVARSGVGVLGVSLEMSALELGRRMLARLARVPANLIKSGAMSPDMAGRLISAQRQMANIPLSIEDQPGLTMAQISARASAAHRRHGLGLIVVDHMHIVRPDDAHEKHGPTYAFTQVSHGLKALAKRYRCPVLALAQLNRGVEGRDDKRPTLADLRQSGDIEQDADSVTFLYRPEYYLREPPAETVQLRASGRPSAQEEYETTRAQLAGLAELIVAKVRDGETGIVKMRFSASTTSFEPV